MKYANDIFVLFPVHADQGYGRLQGWHQAQGLAAVLGTDGRSSAEDSDRMHAAAAKLNGSPRSQASPLKLYLEIGIVLVDLRSARCATMHSLGSLCH